MGGGAWRLKLALNRKEQHLLSIHGVLLINCLSFLTILEKLILITVTLCQGKFLCIWNAALYLKLFQQQWGFDHKHEFLTAFAHNLNASVMPGANQTVPKGSKLFCMFVSPVYIKMIKTSIRKRTKFTKHRFHVAAKLYNPLIEMKAEYFKNI